jgi:hypothetical protein
VMESISRWDAPWFRFDRSHGGNRRNGSGWRWISRDWLKNCEVIQKGSASDSKEYERYTTKEILIQHATLELLLALFAICIRLRGNISSDIFSDRSELDYVINHSFSKLVRTFKDHMYVHPLIQNIFAPNLSFAYQKANSPCIMILWSVSLSNFFCRYAHSDRMVIRRSDWAELMIGHDAINDFQA